MIFDEPPSLEARWRPELTSRGTFSILSSCLITLGLCIWTAVHLNIPDHDSTPKHSQWDPRSWVSQQQRRRLGWLVLGMLAPEMVAFTAWSQWREARILTREMRYLLKTRDISPSPKSASASEGDIELGNTRASPKLHLKDQNWSMVHSFYVLMGGFVVDISELPDNEKFFPLFRNRLTLTPKTILFLAEHEPSLLDIPSEADLRDRSKANGITKVIVCLQATWFLVQFISRLSQGLAASLLELNTAAHALCALLIYCLWWSKPLDIDEATAIPGKKSRELFAILCFFWRFGRVKLPLWRGVLHSKSSQISSRDCDQFKSLPSSTEESKLVLGASSSHLDGHSSGLNGCESDQGTPQPTDLTSGCTQTRLESCCQTQAMPTQPIALKMEDGEIIGRFTFRQARYSPYRQEGKYIYYTLHDHNRWLLASDGWDKYGAVAGEAFQKGEPLRRRVKNWPPLNLLEACFVAIGSLFAEYNPSDKPKTVQFFVAFTVAGIVYGAIHLLAWEGPFHCHVERLLWRISGIAVASSGPLFFFPAALAVLGSSIGYIVETKLETKVERELGDFFATIIEIFFIFLIFIVTIFYLFARTYLVVGCFLQLPYLPDSAFQQPQWSYYFPHII